MSKVIRIDDKTQEELNKFKNKIISKYDDQLEYYNMEEYYSKPNNLIKVALIYCLQNMK